MLIKATQAVLHQRMDEVLRPLGLTVPQYACLQALRDSPGITGAELARRMFVSRQSMNVVLQGLERRGLIRRSDEAGPRGERVVGLTDAAGSVLDQAQADVAEVAARMAAPLSAPDAARLQELLARCRDALLTP